MLRNCGAARSRVGYNLSLASYKESRSDSNAVMRSWTPFGARLLVYIPRVELRMRNKKLTTPMYANGVSSRGPCGSQRLCQVWKVVIEKVDDRNAERIMRTESLDRFVIKSLPTDVPVIS